MKSIPVWILLIILSTASYAQSPESQQKSAMKKLAWWIGEWKGMAISKTGSGGSDTSFMHESIRYDLDSTIILINGIGHRVTNNRPQDEITHHAFAVLSYDNNAAQYRWQAWRIPGGIYTEYAPVVGENSFAWSMKTNQGNMRYNLQLNADHIWQETGEFSRDGNNWFPFFNMKLSRAHDEE